MLLERQCRCTMQRTKPEKRSKSSTNFLCLHNKNKLQLLDGASAILSAGALGIAVYFLASRDSGQYMIRMSEANVIVAGNNTALYRNDPTQNTTKLLQATCKAKEDPRSILSMALQSMFGGFLLPLSEKNSFEIRAVQAKYNDVFYRGATYHMAAGEYDPLLALVWIFACSTAFQAARVRLFVQVGDRQRNNGAKFFNEYRPYAGPDFWRWVEYALTAPLQIVLIASSFTIDDKSMLLLLGGLQGALMLLGYVIELQIEKVCKGKRKSDADHRKRHHSVKLVYLLVSAWALHAVVWYVLVERFDRQKSNISACGYAEKMPDIVNFIVFGQFVLFSLFGLAQTVQVVLVLMLPRSQTPYSKLPRESYSVDEDERLLGEDTPSTDTARWEWISVAYGVLSVVSKTMLEYGFLVLLDVLPTVDK